jgi:radical SAM superfamily enzyme YgiQ (UPF0313 family)
MASKTVILVSFQEQPNLGVGYLGSVLLDANFDLKILDFRLRKERILHEIRNSNPLIVGFSVIYQYHIHEFGRLVDYLRKNDVGCHFCAGGHYPSLRPKEFIASIPSIDSIVLFEGEVTFKQLVKALYNQEEWRTIKGIAYAHNGSAVINPHRALVRDIDGFPPPYRPHLKEFAVGKKYATLLAGRGCVYNCSFCSVHKFYATPPGPVKRMRRPEMVVREMELLHDQMGCSVFMFQDDDFPVAKPSGPEWARAFCRLLRKKSLDQKVLWKINCRPDEIEAALFHEMHQCGLFLTYLGIESGTDEGLRFMNKNTDACETRQGVETLKRLDILYDYGFMLFDPSTTKATIRRNLLFLAKIIGDGTSPIGFGKMRPYAETRIEADLRKQGRLIERKGFEDYDFLDQDVNDIYALVTTSFADWIGSHDGVMNLAKWVRYFIHVYKRFYGNGHAIGKIETQARAIISESNRFALNQIGNICDRVGSHTPVQVLSEKILLKTQNAHRHYQKRLNELIRDVKSLDRYN